MENRFRFRVWHKPTNKMVDCYGFNKDFVFGDVLDGIGTTYNPAKTEDCILMQCTGMKDNNGKLIYEGDIVEIWKMAGNIHKKMLVKWRETQSGFRLYDLSAIEATPQKLCDVRSMGAVTTIRILGNIYENKEMAGV